MIINVKKIYKGKVSLRDYIITQALRLNEDIIVLHRGEKMTLTMEQLRSQGSTDGVVHFSKFNKLTKYKLIDFKWVVDDKRYRWESYQNENGEWMTKQVLDVPEQLAI